MDISSDQELSQQMKPLIKSFQVLLVEAVSQEEEDFDAETKHLLQVIISTLSLLTLRLPPDHANTIKVKLYMTQILSSWTYKGSYK